MITIIYIKEIIENRETIFLDLKSNFFAQYESRRKTDIKRGKERLSFENVENQLMLNIFPELYYQNMKDVSANKFYFFCKKYIKEIIESEFTDNWIVKYQNKVVAATITIRSDKSKIAEYHLSANNLMGKK